MLREEIGKKYNKKRIQNKTNNNKKNKDQNWHQNFKIKCWGKELKRKFN
jgi:hypothetical protein